MALRNLFKRKQTDDDAARRARLLSAGRIADGVVLDAYSDEDGLVTQIFYSYHINGVEYESSHLLDDQQRSRQAEYAPGARITIRYDPRQPVNSLVV